METVGTNLKRKLFAAGLEALRGAVREERVLDDRHHVHHTESRGVFASVSVIQLHDGIAATPGSGR